MSNKNFVAYGDAETVLTEFADDIKGKENKFRYSTMPTASSTNVEQIIQYIGATTQDYTNGYFYKCVAQGTDPETYAWEAQPVQEGGGGADKEDKFRVTTMPTASAILEGKVYQYLGITDSMFVHNYYYECQQIANSNPIEYEWINVNVQQNDTDNLPLEVKNGKLNIVYDSIWWQP